MGNSTSSPTSTPVPSSRSAGRQPPSNLTTPRVATGFTSTDTSPGTSSSSRNNSSSKSKPARRRSIELGDTDSSLTFTSTNSTAGPSTGRPLSGRKQAARLADIIVDDEVEVGGTLRGAMLGKADHVVYGPRRIDGIAPSTQPSSQLSSSASSSPRSSRPASVAMPSIKIGSETTRDQATRLTDPDDTMSPLYRASSRLTSQVRSSSDEIPIVASPVESSPLAAMYAPVDSSGLSSPTSLVDPVDIDFSGSTLLPSSSSPRTSADTILPKLSNGVAASLNRGDTSSSALSTSSSPGTTTSIPSQRERALSSSSGTTHLLPPTLLNAPIAAVPIPLESVPSSTMAASIRAAAVDLGAGPEGVPTLIKWQDEDGQSVPGAGGAAFGPSQVFVTGTFAKGWKTKIELKKNNASDFSVLILLPPGPHRLKFIVDKEWKASRHLPAATDADGNLINYLHVKQTTKSTPWSEWTSGSPASKSIPFGTSPSGVPSAWSAIEEDAAVEDSWGAAEDSEWTSEIPSELLEWGEWEAEREAAEIAAEAAGDDAALQALPPPPALTNGVPPPSLPAQLEKGPLNHAAYVTQGSGDDNSILPKPDHSVINHLAASPIKGGFLSVGVTTRYKRKFVTVVYYKALNTA